LTLQADDDQNPPKTPTIDPPLCAAGQLHRLPNIDDVDIDFLASIWEEMGSHYKLWNIRNVGDSASGQAGQSARVGVRITLFGDSSAPLVTHQPNYVRLIASLNPRYGSEW
jgi:hypothetical protein